MSTRHVEGVDLAQALREIGYAGFGVDAVADAAGVTPQTVYRWKSVGGPISEPPYERLVEVVERWYRAAVRESRDDIAAPLLRASNALKPRSPRAERPELDEVVRWNGRTIGQLSPAERRVVLREAAARLQDELRQVLAVIAAEDESGGE